MKKHSVILIAFTLLLSFGQQLMAFSGYPVLESHAEIKPIPEQEESSGLPQSAGYLLNSGKESETIFHHSNRLSPQFSESNSNEEELRERAEEENAKRKKRAYLVNAEVIERSLTFRELIYPHHFHF